MSETVIVRCASCGRKDGNLPFGIVVNAIGCTGACLHWAIHAIGDPPPGCRGMRPGPAYIPLSHWEDWGLSDEDCTFVELIFSDVNPQGCSMLKCYDGQASDWIDILCFRYQETLDAAPPEFIVANYPRLPGIYNILCTLHRQLSELPTLILTLKVAMCADASLQVSTCTMSGGIIWQEKLGSAAVIGEHAGRVLLQLEKPFRVANDFNLYTREEFAAHYDDDQFAGQFADQHQWRWASPLYEGAIKFVSEHGQVLGDGMDTRSLTSLVVVQPTGETNG